MKFLYLVKKIWCKQTIQLSIQMYRYDNQGQQSWNRQLKVFQHEIFKHEAFVISFLELNPDNRGDYESHSELGRQLRGNAVHTDYTKLQITGQDPSSNYTMVTFSADKGKDA